MTGGAPLLRPFERAWAESIFAAILGPTGDHGLPDFDAIDRSELFRVLGTAPGPTFGPGLRAMLYTLVFLPTLDPRYRRPLFALDAPTRMRFFESIADHPSYLVRQMVATMKMLACFAYFDDPAVRARFRPDEAR